MLICVYWRELFSVWILDRIILYRVIVIHIHHMSVIMHSFCHTHLITRILKFFRILLLVILTSGCFMDWLLFDFCYRMGIWEIAILIACPCDFLRMLGAFSYCEFRSVHLVLAFWDSLRDEGGGLFVCILEIAEGVRGNFRESLILRGHDIHLWVFLYNLFELIIIFS